MNGLHLFRAEKLKPFFSFKGFWENATHYTTTKEHAEKYLAEGCALKEEYLPTDAKILDLTDKGDFVDNHFLLKETIPELKAAWNKHLIRFDLEVIKQMGYDAVRFNDALGESIVK